jgi:uncharacterized protein (DUF2141 family)
VEGFRCASAVYAARLVYSSIGNVLRRRGCDPLSGRAIVPKSRKLLLALRALVVTVFAFAWACTSSASPQPQAPIATRVEPPPLAAEIANPPTPVAAATPEAATPEADTPVPAAPESAAPESAPESATAEPATPAPAPATPAPAKPATGQVVVDIRGLQSTEGQLLVALYRSGKGFPNKGAKAFGKRVAKPRASRARIVFQDIPPGPFAITVHHDANGDFAMETGLFGMPEEGYGFSRDASAPFGPPDFSSAKLTLSPSETKRVPVRMRY